MKNDLKKIWSFFIVIYVIIWYSIFSTGPSCSEGLFKATCVVSQFFFYIIIRFNFGLRNREFASPTWRRRCSDMAHQSFFFTRATLQIFMIAEGNFTVQAVLFTVQILAARRGEALHTQNKFLLLFYNCCYAEDPVSRHPSPPRRYHLRPNSGLTLPHFPLQVAQEALHQFLLKHTVVFDPMKYTFRALIVLRLGYCV